MRKIVLLQVYLFVFCKQYKNENLVVRIWWLFKPFMYQKRIPRKISCAPPHTNRDTGENLIDPSMNNLFSIYLCKSFT